MESTPAAKQWGIGVELAEDHAGAIRFAATLTQLAGADVEIGIHVIPDQERLHPLVGHEQADEIRKRVVVDVGEVLAREGLTRDRVRVELVEDDEIERGLTEAAIRLAVDALIIGRRAKREEDPLIRLGAVARRVLRRLPIPVIVVPPDYGAEDDAGLGEGPIIVGVDLSEHGVAAAKFGQELHWGVSYIPAATMERLQTQTRENADHKLEAWATEHGITSARRHVFMGDPAKHLVQLAYAERAAVLVTGSRMLGPVERLFLASVSSEVAAAANCPVAVVPG